MALAATVSRLAATDVEIVVQTGHEIEVLGIAYSPDGRLLVSSGESDAIRVWDARTGDLVRTLPGHAERVRGLAMSSDGRSVATSSTDGVVKVWDYLEGSLRWTFTNHVGGWVRAVAFSPDGRWLAPAAYDRRLCVWDVTTGQTLRCWDMPGRAANVTFTPDGGFILSAMREENDPRILVHDARTGRLVRSLNVTNLAAQIAISRDGRRLASARTEGLIRVWDFQEGRQERSFRASSHPVEALAMSPDGTLIASSDGLDICLWETATGRMVHRLSGHTEEVLCLAFRPDGLELASGGSDATLRQWSVRDGSLTRVIPRRAPISPVASLAFSRDGGFEAIAAANGVIRLWNLPQGSLVHTLEGHEGPVYTLQFTPQDTWLCSGGGDRTMRVWRLDSGALSAIYPLFNRGDEMGAVAVGGTQGWVATASGPWSGFGSSPDIKLWPLMFDRPARILHGHGAAVVSVAYARELDRVASAALDRTVKLWDPRTGACLRTLTLQAAANVVAFHPVTHRVAAGMADGTVLVLDPESFTVERQWRAHRGFVQSLVVSDDGRWLATAGEDRTVAVWDWASGSERRRFPGVTSRYLPLAFHPRDPVLAFAQRDDRVIHASVETGEVLLQRVLFPDGEWLAWNPGKAYYAASAGGELHARLRFPGQAAPVYPLELYRRELLCRTNLLAALATPAPLLVHKDAELWWHRYPYKSVWLYTGAAILACWTVWRLRRGWLAERGRRAQVRFSRQLLQAQETERQRIAAELHDGLGQLLLITKNQVTLARITRDRDPNDLGSLNAISDNLSQSIEEVRTISRNLRPYQLGRLGLTKALLSAARSVTESGRLHVETNVTSIDNLFPAEWEIHVYRIVQECLNNILKHAGATTARLSVLRDEGHIAIRVEDDGCGFDYRRATSGEHAAQGLGLNSLAERVRILAGRVHCESAPGKGTHMKFDIPIPKTHE